MRLFRLLCFVPLVTVMFSVCLPSLDASDNADSTKPPVSQKEEPPKPKPTTAEILQNGQSIEISVYREPDLSGVFTVDDFGDIAFPLLGEIPTNGKTLEQLKEELIQGLRKYVVDPQVTVRPGKSSDSPKGGSGNSAAITVLGEVRQPSTYDSARGLKLTTLLARAGGFAPEADTTRVRLIRQTDGRQDILFFDLVQIQSGNAEDPDLAPGDKIVVPKKTLDTDSAAVLGEVKSAGMFEVTPDTTLLRLIAKAGGFTPLAATSKIRVVRKSGAEKKVFLYNAAMIMNGDADDPKIESGDMIFVPESFF